MLAFEAVAAGLLIRLFWVSSPEDFALLGGILLLLLLVSWGLAYSVGAKVRAAASDKLETRGRVFLVLGAVLGLCGLGLGLVGGPHLAGIMVYGFGAQALALGVGRVAVAI